MFCVDNAQANDFKTVRNYVVNQDKAKNYGDNFVIYKIEMFDTISQDNAQKIFKALRLNGAITDRMAINVAIDDDELDVEKQVLLQILEEIPYELILQLELKYIYPEIGTDDDAILNVNIVTRPMTMFEAKSEWAGIKKANKIYARDIFKKHKVNFFDKLNAKHSITPMQRKLSNSGSVNVGDKGNIENRELNRSFTDVFSTSFGLTYKDAIGENDLVINADTSTTTMSRSWNYSSLTPYENIANLNNIDADEFGISNNTNNKSSMYALYSFGDSKLGGNFKLTGLYNNIEEQYENTSREDDNYILSAAINRNNFYEVGTAGALKYNSSGKLMELGSEVTIRKLEAISLSGDSNEIEHFATLRDKSKTEVSEAISTMYVRGRYNFTPKIIMDSKIAYVNSETKNGTTDIRDNLAQVQPSVKIEYNKDKTTKIRALFNRQFSKFYYKSFAFRSDVNNNSSLKPEETTTAQLEFERQLESDAKLVLSLRNDYVPNKIGLVPIYDGNDISGQVLSNGLDENSSYISASLNYPLYIAESQFVLRSSVQLGVKQSKDVFDKVSGDRLSDAKQSAFIEIKQNKSNNAALFGAYLKMDNGGRYFTYNEQVITPKNAALGISLSYVLGVDTSLEAEFSTPLNRNNQVIRTKYDIENNKIDYVNIRDLSWPTFRMSLKKPIN